MKSQIHISADAESLAEFARQWLLELIDQHTRSRSSHFTLGLSGGSTPKRLYRLLAELPAGRVNWENIVLVWGDERNFPKEHAESNYRMVKESLLDHIDIPHDNVLAVPNPGALPEVAAQQYEALLRNKLPSTESGFPTLDCILLGIGDDVHTASLFPQTMALRETSRWTVANHVPQLNTWRVTLTAPFINAARNVAFLVSGSAKQSALQTVWHGPANPQQYPAQLIKPTHGKLWFLAEQAAVQGVKIPAASAARH